MDIRVQEGIFAIIVAFIMLLIALSISFFITAGAIWLVCWGFGIAFMWKYVFATWGALILLKSVFK